jgi:S1-C subfamily serine protease
MIKFITAVVLTSLAGCAGTNREYVQDLKTESLDKYPTDVIDVIVHFPERVGSETENRDMPATNYLIMHTGFIFAGEELDDETFQQAFSRIKSTVTEEGISWGGLPRTRVAFSAGAAVAITDDGYFLTAAHVVEGPNSHLVYITSDEEHTYFDAKTCRVVHSDPETDIAIVKVEMATPRYLRIRETSLTPGEVIFGGNGWLKQSSAGEYIKVYIHGEEVIQPDAITDGTYIRTSIPGIDGDSGSPLIDRNGELCGIASFGNILNFIRLRNLQDLIVASLERNVINQIITRDRKISQPRTE